jgi:hypothetical protein
MKSTTRTGGDVVAYQQQHTHAGWSRTRWIVVAAVVVAVAVVIVLALTYSGGGGGSTGY